MVAVINITFVILSLKAFVCLFVCRWGCAGAHMWRSQDSLQELLLARGLTQVIRVDSKCCYLLSPLTSPVILYYCSFYFLLNFFWLFKV